MKQILEWDHNHFHTYGDVYEALEASGQLSRALTVLKRRHLLSDEDWGKCRVNLTIIETAIETTLPDSPEGRHQS